MPQLRHWAALQPNKAAYVFPGETEQTTTCWQLDQASNRVAQWLIAEGLKPGDAVAILTENHPRMFEIMWGATRAGLYYTPLSTHLKPAEISYILKDSGAKLLIASARLAELAGSLDECPNVEGRRYMFDGTAPGYASYEDALSLYSDGAALPERPIGRDFLYSSGTTGNPKGIRRPLTPLSERNAIDDVVASWVRSFGFGAESVYLSPAPLYHAAPLRYCMRMVTVGGTAIVMRRFDAEQALETIEHYRATHSQWVPTMFVRLLNLPAEVKERYDLSSLRVAIHAAAPCPVAVKERMIEWWGPIIHEYYSGSEALGMTAIGAADWLTHKGSVGRATIGVVHIVGEDGQDLPVGEVGTVYFADGPVFEYHNAPEKTRAAFNGRGWATYGDLGWLDEDGYLYLSDRRADLIISGGVNIYPAEIEDVLMTHPEVADAAVIGVAHAEFGEEVKAIVELKGATPPGPAAAERLIAHCREHLSHLKCPRTIDFEAHLPRLENGKLLRRVLKERYRRPAAATG